MNDVSALSQRSVAFRAAPGTSDETQETRLWLEEHDWLYGLLRSSDNTSPTFRFPDLISAGVSLLFLRPDASTRIFGYLCGKLVLRDPQTPRRRESMWRGQYELLQELQRSPANQHPHPKFQLDQLTTACIALCREDDESGRLILRQARLNMAQRAQGWATRQPG
ncbi:MAG TPA: hypothetical protein PK620_01920 [Denitromonas sp.]|nr:hypothetical protein [Denitromonas sp.]